MIEMLLGKKSKAAPGHLAYSGMVTRYVDVPAGYSTLDVILIGVGADGVSGYGGGGGGYLSVQDLAVEKNDRLRISITDSGSYIYDGSNQLLASVAAASAKRGGENYEVNTAGAPAFYPGGQGGSYYGGYGGGGGSAGRYGSPGGDGARYSTYTSSTTKTRPAWDGLGSYTDANQYDWDIRIDKSQFRSGYEDSPGSSPEGFIIAARYTDSLNGMTYYTYYRRVSEQYTVNSTHYRVAYGTPSGSAGQGRGGYTGEDGEGAGLYLDDQTPDSNGYGFGGGRNRSGGYGAVEIKWG